MLGELARRAITNDNFWLDGEVSSTDRKISRTEKMEGQQMLPILLFLYAPVVLSDLCLLNTHITNLSVFTKRIDHK